MVPHRQLGAPPDGGFTLVEVVVSMVLLGLAALLVLPALVTGSRAAVADRDISRASQHASAELVRARALVGASSCATVKAATGGRLQPDPEGYTIIDTVTGDCTTGTTLQVSTTVTSTSNPSRSVTASTLVPVTS